LASPIDEGALIGRTTVERLPSVVDGRAAIEEMKRSGSGQWRQMEWIGWWFEHFFTTVVGPSVGARPGPKFGRTRFDLQREFVWDLKAHPTNEKKSRLILNDCEAIDSCLEMLGGVGFVVVSGRVSYDESGEFKAWHDALKGGTSAYERERVLRGARSRRRKVAFEPQEVSVFYFNSGDALAGGLKSGWLGLFQEGMRNSNGRPRRPKYSISPSRVPGGWRLLTLDV
jgi:hypothetical protein